MNIKIPNHRIEEEIGKGGMATVYLATHVLMNSKRAIKIMAPYFAGVKGFQNKFIDEAKTIHELDHPNIVRIHDIGITNDQMYYMSMEYLSGGSLKDKIGKYVFTFDEVVAIMQQLGSGLTHAHQHGYIHRDIKPGNILFKNKHFEKVYSSNDFVKLADFGIAKLQGTISDLSLAGITSGTALYMSPEQAKSTEKIDHRSDIYCLGLVFYEMLTAEKAAKANTTVQAIHFHAYAPTPILPDKYNYLQPVLEKALEKDPEKRYQTVQEFVDALEFIQGKTNFQLPSNNVQETQIVPVPSSPKKEYKKDKRSSKAFTILGSISLVLLAVAGTWYFMQPAPMKPKPEAVSEVQPQTTASISLPTPISQREIDYFYTPEQNYKKLQEQLQLLVSTDEDSKKLLSGNTEANKILEEILNEYHSIAIDFLISGNFDGATQLINEALTIYPEHQELKELNNAINNRFDPLPTSQQSIVHDLLEDADKKIESGKFTTPEDNNAVDIYRKAISIAPGNRDIAKKLEEIFSVFENKIKDSIGKDNYTANQILNQALAIFPFNERLISYQKTIKDSNTQ